MTTDNPTDPSDSTRQPGSSNQGKRAYVWGLGLGGVLAGCLLILIAALQQTPTILIPASIALILGAAWLRLARWYREHPEVG